jgi:hypothetical protein
VPSAVAHSPRAAVSPSRRGNLPQLRYRAVPSKLSSAILRFSSAAQRRCLSSSVHLSLVSTSLIHQTKTADGGMATEAAVWIPDSKTENGVGEDTAGPLVIRTQ